MKRICEKSKRIYQDGHNYGRNPKGHIDQYPKKAGCLEHRQREAGYSSKGGGVPVYHLNSEHSNFHESLGCSSLQNYSCNPLKSLMVGKNKGFFQFGSPNTHVITRNRRVLTAHSGFRYDTRLN